MSDFNLSFGERLKLIRQTRGLTADELAEKAGFSQAYISKMEGGHHPHPRSHTVEKLAGALNVSPAELLYDQAVAINQIFDYMPKDIQTWLTKKDIAPYLTLAMELHGMKIPPEHIRKVALLYLELKEDGK